MLNHGMVKRSHHQILTETYPLLLKVLSYNTDGIWEWDILTDKMTWATPIYEVFKLSASIEEIDFDFIQNKLVHPSDSQKENLV